jgi:hypothetical protein
MLGYLQIKWEKHMQFTPRGGGHPASQSPQPMPAAPHQPHGRRKRIDWAGRTVRLELFILILGSALLLAAVSLYLALGGGSNGEAKRVDESKYQAVFLNGGVTSGSVSYSTYFGHLTKVNDKYFVLNDVYYLTDQSSAKTPNASPQLTKLGCQQLHSPYDEMVINRTQVAFWENLKDDGKVVQAIKQYKQQNPNGPNCNAQSTTPTSAQPATNP